MRKKLIIGLLFLLVAGMSTTFGYYMSDIKSNEVEIIIGEPEEANFKITQIEGVGRPLIPEYAEPSNTLEVKTLKFKFNFKHSDNFNYKITYDLPEGLYIPDIDPDKEYGVNFDYTFYIKMNAPIDETSVVIHINAIIV